MPCAAANATVSLEAVKSGRVGARRPSSAKLEITSRRSFGRQSRSNKATWADEEVIMISRRQKRLTIGAYLHIFKLWPINVF